MKTITVALDVEDDEVEEVIGWLRREMLTDHPWIPGALLTHVKDIRIEEPSC